MVKPFNLKTAVLFLSILSLTAKAQHTLKNKFTINGNIVGQNTNVLRLTYLNQNEKETKDSCIVKNGVFSFTGFIDGPVNATLTGNTKTHSSDDPNYCRIFLMPAKMKMSLVENDFKNLKLSGSKTQDDFRLLEERKRSNSKQEDELGLKLTACNEKISHGDTSTETKVEKELIWARYQKLRALDQLMDYEFIGTHPGSYLSPYLMEYYFSSRKLPLDSAKLFFNSLKSPVKESKFGRDISSAIMARVLSSTGKPAPDFSKTTLNGQEITLEHFRGKSFIIIDFWASWCQPCRAVTPELSEMYRKYHAKGLDIVSISWDSDRNAWLDAIKKDKTQDWHQVFADLYHESDNGLRKLYDIPSIPFYVLIDKNGTIIGRYGPDGDDGNEAAMFSKLESIFFKN